MTKIRPSDWIRLKHARKPMAEICVRSTGYSTATVPFNTEIKSSKTTGGNKQCSILTYAAGPSPLFPYATGQLRAAEVCSLKVPGIVHLERCVHRRIGGFSSGPCPQLVQQSPNLLNFRAWYKLISLGWCSTAT